MPFYQTLLEETVILRQIALFELLLLFVVVAVNFYYSCFICFSRLSIVSADFNKNG